MRAKNASRIGDGADSRRLVALLSHPDVIRLRSAPFPCPNCDGVTDNKVFCSPYCEDAASYVRYFRACIADGRSEKRDVQKALRTRLALLLGGGYNERLRWLSKPVRDAVFARDDGRCVKCGAAGEQIDHIRGHSNALINLQLLCKPCHETKTEAGFVSFSRASHPKIAAKRDGLLLRAWALHPERTCDDEVDWRFVSRAIRSARHRVIREVKERCSGKRCPVCLAALKNTPRPEYLRTHQKRLSFCLRCSARVIADAQCSRCNSATVWANESAAACSRCGTHGLKSEIIAG